jgi:nucleoside-diphosphate-sugar epimerase
LCVEGIRPDFASVAHQRLLVTGATGYIGGQLVRRLAREGRDLVALTRGDRRLDVPSVRGDILDAASLRQAFRGVDLVCHCAGRLGKWTVPEAEVREVNVVGARNVVEAAHATGVKHLVHLSAAGVVGPRGLEPANEETVCHPCTLYERTKLEGELVVRNEATRLGLPFTMVRPSFTYGPADPHKLGLFKTVKQGLFFFIGDGYSTTHPVYIDDLLDGLLLIMEQRPRGRTFILGGPRPVSKRELVTIIAEELGVRPPWAVVPVLAARALASALEAVGRAAKVEPPLTHSRVLAMSRSWGMDIQRARDELGYMPRVDLREGIRNTVESYRRMGAL